MTGYLYRETKPGLWSVGYYEPGSFKWILESDHLNKEDAASRTAWLNGAGKPRRWDSVNVKEKRS